MDNFERFLSIWFSIFTLDIARYFIGVSLVAVVLLVIFRSWSDRRRIQSRRASGDDRRREIVFSVLTTVVYAFVGFGTFSAREVGILHVYRDVDSYGWVYTALSLPLVLVLHDAYFYWAHRAMHHRKLFRFFHRIHHLSRTPTPWAAYAFAPGEAVVMALFVPLVTLIVPLHQTVLFIFLAIMIVRNAQGHSGIEFHPRWWIDSPLDIFTTVTHHDLHHQRFTGNYGLYFTWWDRLMGTEAPDYREQFLAVAGEKNPKGAGFENA